MGNIKNKLKKLDASAVSKPKDESNTAAAIEEKRLISDLQLAGVANGGRDAERFCWAMSRKAVRRMLEEARSLSHPPATLFLRLHYPFFDAAVQTVLMERHPVNCQVTKRYPWHAVDAYLLAEQYGLVAYGDDSLINLDLIERSAQFYFVHDLQWFSRLLVAIAKAISVFKNTTIPSLPTWALRLQGWNNRYSDADKTPKRWLEETEYLASAKQFKLNNPTKKNRMSSVTPSASDENKRRREIFQTWLPCWQSNLERLNALLKPVSTKP